MRGETSSLERPSKSSASVRVPSSVSNRYSFSTGTHGSSRRCRASSSPIRVCSFSRSSSSSRADCHSSRLPSLCSVIARHLLSHRVSPLDRLPRTHVRLRSPSRPHGPFSSSCHAFASRDKHELFRRCSFHGTPGLAGYACRVFGRNGLLLPRGIQRRALGLKDLPGDDQAVQHAV